MVFGSACRRRSSRRSPSARPGIGLGLALDLALALGLALGLDLVVADGVVTYVSFEVVPDAVLRYADAISSRAVCDPVHFGDGQSSLPLGGGFGDCGLRLGRARVSSGAEAGPCPRQRARSGRSHRMTVVEKPRRELAMALQLGSG